MVHGESEEWLAVEGMIDCLKDYLVEMQGCLKDIGSRSVEWIKELASDKGKVVQILNKIYGSREAFIWAFCRI